jgi:predicted nucleic acid-binding protein
LIIETDVLLAALNPKDPVNGLARKVIEHDVLMLSPFSLLEVNLLVRAGTLEISDFDEFARDLGALLDARTIRILNDRPEYHSEAHRLETRYKLTFFDSLHGAVSKVQREIIVSFDRVYDGLSKEGVRRLDPKDI